MNGTIDAAAADAVHTGAGSTAVEPAAIFDTPEAILDAPWPAADRPACPRALFLVSPDGFGRAGESASDNRYMAAAERFDGGRALAQHRALHAALSDCVPTVCFPGDPQAPDAVFPNNVFATAPGRYLVGRMRHPVRQREADRSDLHRFFAEVLGLDCLDLRRQPGICELTGSMVIDRARGVGFAGLSERCDAAGAAAMHAGFRLRRTFRFELAAGEYHTNVVMSVLASRAVVLWPGGFADPAVPAAIASRYAPHVVELDDAEAGAFAGNCIAVSPDRVWMSEAAAAALRPASRAGFTAAGFVVSSVPLDAIEAAGGSLRCCVGEIY